MVRSLSLSLLALLALCGSLPLSADNNPSEKDVTAVPPSVEAAKLTEKVDAPKSLYKCSDGTFLLNGKTGLSTYVWKGVAWSNDVTYRGLDGTKQYFVYEEDKYPGYKWAFARHPDYNGKWRVYFMPGTEVGGKPVYVFFGLADRYLRAVEVQQKARLAGR